LQDHLLNATIKLQFFKGLLRNGGQKKVSKTVTMQNLQSLAGMFMDYLQIYGTSFNLLKIWHPYDIFL